MPESTSISKRMHWGALTLALLSMTISLAARAEGAPGGGEKSKAYTPEEDDFSNTPFTEYGEFSESADEEADTKFFAHGRSHGVSLGLGFEGVTGNRGAVYEGGFPLVDFKLHYWFDFNFALDLNLYYASHFTENLDGTNHVDVNLLHAGLDVKYYFDVKNLSAPLTFANPYLILGFGAYQQTKSSFQENSTDVDDSALGISVGGGLEFPISPRKCYLELEGRYHYIGFNDRFSSDFDSTHGAKDLTGGFFTLIGSVLFTW